MAANSKSGLRYDDFVAKLRPDPKSTEALVMLQGYIGKSDLGGHVRVYSDSELSEFIEIPENDICHHESVRHEEDPLGGSRLWVRQTTVFTTGDPNQVNRVRSSFLEGDLLQAFGAEMAGQAGNGFGYAGISPDFYSRKCVWPVPTAFKSCKIQCNSIFVNQCASAAVCRVAQPNTGTATNMAATLYGKSCKYVITCIPAHCVNETNTRQTFLMAKTVRTSCTCAFDYQAIHPTYPEGAILGYEGGFNPYAAY